MNPYVIGISGNMGSGKSTLTKELARQFKSSYLCWDDFDFISHGPVDYIDWYNRVEDYTEWDYQRLTDVLNCLKTGLPVTHPVLEIPINPTEYIIFDVPLGRLHEQTGAYIDTWVHMDVPPKNFNYSDFFIAID